MPRIRSVHPGQWRDGDFLECSPLARLLCLALRNMADDRGAFRWKPKSIKAECLPCDNCEIDDLLGELIEHDQIIQYEHEGKLYGLIVDFTQWQRPKKPVYVHPIPDALMRTAGLLEAASTSQEMRKRKCDEQGRRCYFCECEITHYQKRATSLEIDHLTPVSRGGSDEDENLVATCRTCNRAKNNKTESEFREWLATRNATDATRSATTEVGTEISPQREEVGGRRYKIPSQESNISGVEIPRSRGGGTCGPF